VADWVRKLEEAWRLAESTRPTAEQGIAMEDLPLELPDGRARAGADSSGFRHLLVPVEEDAAVDGLFDGRSILLRRRPLIVEGSLSTFAALTCTRGELFPEFSTLAADVLAAVEADPRRPLRAVRSVLTDWRELLRSLGGRGLDRNAVTGLYGELLLLEQIVRADPRRRTDCWRGADAARHDFQRGSTVAEAKTTAARRGRTFMVHGVDQLQAPPETTLYLCWTRLEVAVDRGESLRALVDRLTGLIADVPEFTRKLQAIDYRPQEPDDYTQPRFIQLESAAYRVEGDFPRLIPQSFAEGRLPTGIAAVSYEVDLGSRSPLSDDETAAVISELAGL
jgi:hypothetical protein